MPALTLAVLGTSPAYPNPGGACAGYLVEGGGARLLVDCGPGVAARLRLHLEPDSLDAILISHLHRDHFLDLVPIRDGLKYFIPPSGRPARVLLPPGGVELLADLGRVVGGTPDFFAEVLDLGEYDPNGALQFGRLRVRFRPVLHYIPSHAMRFEVDARAIVYSSDLAPCDAIVEHARGAQLLLHECGLRSPEQDAPHPAARGHTAPAEAGAVARQAGVERLLLIHYPVGSDLPERLERARLAFGGPTEWAEEGGTYSVP